MSVYVCLFVCCCGFGLFVLSFSDFVCFLEFIVGWVVVVVFCVNYRSSYLIILHPFTTI